MNAILLDTNILIYALAGKEPFASKFANWLTENTLVLSSITVAEFLSGATEKDTLGFSRLLEKVPVLPVDRVVAEQAARYKKRFSGKKKKVWLSDCFIAATTKVYGLQLVTYDKKDFPMKDIAIRVLSRQGDILDIG